jgi:putative FmdB family regulatory protein
MPLYEYECEACGERFEVIRKFSDPPLDDCKQCGDGPIRRLPSSPAIQFKGSGFYITDYPKTGDAGRADKQSSEQKQDAKSDAAAAGNESKAEDKTEGKTDSKADASSGTGAKPDALAKSDAAAKPSTQSAATTTSRKKD